MLRNRNVRDWQKHVDALTKWIDAHARLATIEDLTSISEKLLEARERYEIDGQPTEMSRAAAGCLALNEFIVGKMRGQDLAAFMFAEMQDQAYRLTWARIFSDAFWNCDKLGVESFRPAIEAIWGIAFLIDMETRIPWSGGVVE